MSASETRRPPPPGPDPLRPPLVEGGTLRPPLVEGGTLRPPLAEGARLCRPPGTTGNAARRPVAAAAGATRRALLLGLPLCAALAMRPLPLRAEGTYPAQPVTVIAPFSAGGAADIAARSLARFAPRHLPNPAAEIRVENRTGASGAVGTQFVARAVPDGATLLLARVASAAILPATDPRTPYAWNDFTMLGLLDENPFVVAVRADAPWRTLGELLIALREQPGTLSFATTGPATILDLGIRQLFATAGLPIDAANAVPFRGGGDAVQALLGGQVQFLGNNLSDTAAAIAEGRARALVLGSATRLPSLPGVPTAAEAEVPELARISGWNALFGPPGLPAPVVAAWTAALGALGRDEGWLAEVRRVGSIPRVLGPAETRTFVESQVTLYRDLAKRLGLI